MQLSQSLFNFIQYTEFQRVVELKNFLVVVGLFVLVDFFVFFKFRNFFALALIVSLMAILSSFYIYNSRYKNSVLNNFFPKLITSIDPDFDYRSDKKLSKDYLNGLKLYQSSIDTQISRGSFILKGGILELFLTKLINKKVDTEEGDHDKVLFDGVVIHIKSDHDFDQKYLLSNENLKSVNFEVGDYLNAKSMALKDVTVLRNDFRLFSSNGENHLSKKWITKIVNFTENSSVKVRAVFDKQDIYIFADGLRGGLKLSLFAPIKDQYIIRNYQELLKRVKSLINF